MLSSKQWFSCIITCSFFVTISCPASDSEIDTPLSSGRNTPLLSDSCPASGSEIDTPLSSGRNTPLLSGDCPASDGEMDTLLSSGRNTPLLSGDCPESDSEIDTPLSSGRNTPLLSGRNTPLLSGRNTPLLSGRNTPLLRDKSTPLLRGKSTPLLRGKSAPLLKGKTTPLLKGKTTPLSSGRNTPLIGSKLVISSIGHSSDSESMLASPISMTLISDDGQILLRGNCDIENYDDDDVESTIFDENDDGKYSFASAEQVEESDSFDENVDGSEITDQTEESEIFDENVGKHSSITIGNSITMGLQVKHNRFNILSLCRLPPLESKRETKIILTIDGGGSRGIIPLFFINELMRKLSIATGRDLNRLPVDMYAGTSVGALIAVAASMGKTREMEQRYGSLVQQIFSYKWWKWPFTKLFCGYTYQSEGKNKAIREFITPETESEIQGDLLVPFCSAKTHDTFKYTNYDKDPKFKLSDALMASSAAPTYFPPHIFRGLDNKVYEGTDGGIFANHPGDIALDEARARYPDAKIVMISLGTGHAYSSGETTQTRGLLGWASHIADLCLSLQSKKTNESLINLSESNVHGRYFKYIRINPMLGHDDCITDGISQTHLEHLETVARQSIAVDGGQKRSFDDVLDIFKTRLASIPTAPTITEVDEDIMSVD